MSFSNVLTVWADFCTGWGNRRLEMWCYFSLLTFYYSYFLSRSSTAGLFVIIKVFPMCSPWFMLKQHVIVLWKWSCSYHFQNSWLPPTLNFVPRSRVHTFIQDHEEKRVADLPKVLPRVRSHRLDDVPRVHRLPSCAQDAWEASHAMTPPLFSLNLFQAHLYKCTIHFKLHNHLFETKSVCPCLFY